MHVIGFDTTLTLLNKINGRDSVRGVDEWHKTILSNCSWSVKAIQSTSGSTVNVGAAYIVQIPKSVKYCCYPDWVQQLNGWTISTGDFIVKGVVSEDVTAQNVREIIGKYKPHAFEIRMFQDGSNAFGILEHYRIEGV